MRNRPNAILFWRFHGIHPRMCRQWRCSIFHSVVLWNFHAKKRRFNMIKVVEMRGIEPLASALRTPRSPS